MRGETRRPQNSKHLEAAHDALFGKPVTEDMIIGERPIAGEKAFDKAKFYAEETRADAEATGPAHKVDAQQIIGEEPTDSEGRVNTREKEYFELSRHKKTPKTPIQDHGFSEAA